MNYAEAIYERDDKIENEDLNISLNLVRQRVNTNMPALTNELTQAHGLDMRTEIRRERTVELFNEGFRIDDLKRWKTAENEMPQTMLGIKWKGTEYESWNTTFSLNDEGSVGLGMLSLLLSVASCGDKEYGDAMNEAQLMNDIEVNVGSSLPLAVGMDFVLDYKPVPENVTNPEITLTSSDENVVSVSQDGRVTAKMIGKAYINLSQSTAFETLKTIEVQVMPVATAIELENVELFEGTNKKVIVNVTPSDGYNVFDWKSDNEEVATVADDGTITGKKPGTANISVSSQDGSQLTATAVVTVKEVIPIDKITLSEPGYDMMIGDKTLINCLLEPIDASVGLLSWSTTNDRVATVDADGLVTAVGAGEAEIIAQDPLSGLSASIAVKVVLIVTILCS